MAGELNNTTGNIIWTGTTTTASTGGFDASQYIKFVEIKQLAQDIHPILYFKYVKSKMSMLQGMRMDKRMKHLEAAFDRAVESGQDVLAKKYLDQCVREARESAMFAKGFKYFIEKADVSKFKNKIRGGHISDTDLDKFTRSIPKEVLAKKKAADGLFDSYVVYHHWDEAAEAKRATKQKMTAEEKGKMRDPILFGRIEQTDRLYFIADWEDEYCDLTFDEMVDAVGKEESEHMIPREPKLP